MAIHPRSAKRMARFYARDQLDRNAIERAEREREERAEKKLLAELELEEQRTVPPAEPSPQVAPAEVAKRLEALEAGRREPFNLGLRPPVPEEQQERQNRRRQTLRLLKTKKAAEAETERNKAHEKRCAPLIEKLEGDIAAGEARRTAMVERHRAELGEVDAELEGCQRRLSALVRALQPGETSEQRARLVMGS